MYNRRNAIQIPPTLKSIGKYVIITMGLFMLGMVSLLLLGFGLLLSPLYLLYRLTSVRWILGGMTNTRKQSYMKLTLLPDLKEKPSTLTTEPSSKPTPPSKVGCTKDVGPQEGLQCNCKDYYCTSKYGGKCPSLKDSKRPTGDIDLGI